MPYSFDKLEFIKHYGPQAAPPSEEERAAANDIFADESHKANGGKGYSEDSLSNNDGEPTEDEI